MGPSCTSRCDLTHFSVTISDALSILGLPHRVMEDDIYENYFIPKGTRVVANIWYLLA